MGKSRFASPKNTKNPNTSVAVVRNIAEARAGSMPTAFKVSGIKNPDAAAIIRLHVMAAIIINAR